MIVDSGISTKILINVLKIKVKDHMKMGFDSIKKYQKNNHSISAINLKKVT